MIFSSILLKRWAVATVALILLDVLWFKFGAPCLGASYGEMVKGISGKKAAMNPLGLFVYPLVGYMLARFAFTPIDAAILGLAVFGVYNLSNMFVFDGWKPRVAAIDTTWGCLSLYIVGNILLYGEAYLC